MKNSKVILFSLFIIISISSAKSQGLSYGIKGGFNYAKVSGDVLNADSRSGFHVGGFAKFSLILIAIQPEILYSQRGYTSSNAGTDQETRLNYLEVPIMLKVKVFPLISIDAGPQFSYLINQKTITTISNNATTSKSLSNLNRAETALAIGASLTVIKFGVSARYIMGFDDVSTLSAGKNRMLQLSASLSF